MAVRDISVNGRDFSLAYEFVRPNLENKILFLHGWGANKEVMKLSFGSLFKDFGLIFVDLPGFGGSSNSYVLNTLDYADIIKEFLFQIDVSPFGIIGHSFGGKVAVLLNPPNLALLGSAGIVLPKPLGVRVKIVASKIAKNIGLSESLRKIFASSDAKNMSDEMYETFKMVVDEDFTPHFQNTTSKTALIWGEGDTASPIKAGEFIARLIKNSSLHKVKGDHFFFISNQNLTQNIILNVWEYNALGR